MLNTDEKRILKWAARLIMLLAGLILLGTLLVDNTFDHGKFDKRGDTWYLVSSN